jgi:hypothetical protein
MDTTYKERRKKIYADKYSQIKGEKRREVFHLRRNYALRRCEK